MEFKEFLQLVAWFGLAHSICKLCTSYKPRRVIGRMESREFIRPITRRGLYSRGNKCLFWSIFVSTSKEARRGPKKLRFILSKQKELRTGAEKWNGVFSSFKHGVPSTEESAGRKLTSRNALAVSARSLAIGNSEIYLARSVTVE